ncbi:nickel-dependent lactate racemase [Halanaerobium saccharolyticum]|jgi:nickel-dependent lactate racemase|uniref:Nickel-dependent lactate racemase n=1 Tax=Halanaerobium saccharolyticum TaxID=43595 RepID=A0A2T5RLR5_9FIRM|nr:nickel-dependent lactate racemase [Halanaerobium saccharolyticum]PTW00189.1 nickel-dependent lactate racemase [Halanaerobium saccharolyticum]
MKQIKFPFGRKELELEVEEERLRGVLLSQAHKFEAEKSETEIVKEAMENPIASKKLSELARGKKEIVIISSDHTRPVPSHITMPILLEEIRKTAPEAEITILVATGFHRASTDEELRDKYGDEIVDSVNIEMHDSRDEEQMVNLGQLPSGGDMLLNKTAVEADLLVAEGFIEPHFFAGFSGGRKSVLPGVASKTTVLANHCAEFIDSPNARTGNLEGNPMHKDMLYAAKSAGLAFILNVVIDAEKKVINAFAGHREKAHLKGTEFVDSLAGVDAKPADIVVTTNGGYPLDQNIYQAVKGMTAAEATCKEGGVIIIAAECSDGHGGEEFYQTFRDTDSVQEIMDDILARGRKETVPDQWETQILARIMLKFKVIMITDPTQRQIVEDMGMDWAQDLKAAVKKAEGMLKAESPTITAIPDGVSVIVRQ